MQFVYSGISYHLDTGTVMKDLEIIYLKALQGDEYHTLTQEQKFLLEVAWSYFAGQYMTHDYMEAFIKGQQLYDMIQMGYVEKIAIDVERGEMAVKLAMPVIVN